MIWLDSVSNNNATSQGLDERDDADKAGQPLANALDRALGGVEGQVADKDIILEIGELDDAVCLFSSKFICGVTCRWTHGLTGVVGMARERGRGAASAGAEEGAATTAKEDEEEGGARSVVVSSDWFEWPANQFID